MHRSKLLVWSIILSFALFGCSSDDGSPDSPQINDGADVLAPAFTSASDVNVDENEINVLTLNATDQSSITYSILDGDDSGSFSIDSLSGLVVFVTVPDYETKEIYTFTAVATDVSGNIATQVITIHINDVDENIAAPILHDGITYGVVVSPYTGKKWLDRNLGASEVCTVLNDTACYGGYYQWGRQSDGHQTYDSLTTTNKATDVSSVGHNMFIVTTSGDWADSINNSVSIRNHNWNLADGSSICPVGYRVPSMEELRAETVTSIGDVNNFTDAFNNFLKLPSSGRRDNDGSLLGQDGSVFIWTRDGLALYIGENWQPHNGDLSEGLSVRCVQNMIPAAYNQSTVIVKQNSINNSIILQADDEDKELLSYTLTEQPLHGSLSGTAPNLTYTPDVDYLGNDTFKFSVDDSVADSNIATVDITVSAVISIDTITHHGLEYKEVISPYTAKTWLDRNLGASQVCTALDDTTCYGDYYQWGRNSDGHEKVDSTSIEGQALAVSNAGINLIDADYADHEDWASLTDFDGNLRVDQWSSTDATSVCPSGYRVPTITELRDETVDSSAATSNNTDAFNNFLKLPSSGWRFAAGGLVEEINTVGSLWSSSSTTGTYAYTYKSFMMSYGMSFVEITDRARERAAAVRCIKNY